MSYHNTVRFGFAAIITSEIEEKSSNDLGSGKILKDEFALTHAGDECLGIGLKKLLVWEESVQLVNHEFTLMTSSETLGIDASLRDALISEAKRLEIEIDQESIGWAVWGHIG